MYCVIDCEANGLTPSKIWVISCRTLDGVVRSFIRPDTNPDDFKAFAKDVSVWIGHNILSYDIPNINRLVGVALDPRACIDTLVVSKVVEYKREGGHGLKAWGKTLGHEKPEIDNWDVFSEKMIGRCEDDTEINLRLFRYLEKYINSSLWQPALRTEHDTVLELEEAHRNGFWFNRAKAQELYEEINTVLFPLEEELKSIFPKKSRVIREVTPEYTSKETLNQKDFRFLKTPKEYSVNLSDFNGGPFSLFEWEEFNPGSPKQRIERLWEAGWKPTDKTKGHKDFLKSRSEDPARLAHFEIYGWTTSEENLATLPDTAPEGARKLVQWLLLSSRIRRLDEWFAAYQRGSNRIHGRIDHIGAWTQRCSHSAPNMGNIPKFDAKQPHKTPYSDRMRALWGVPDDRYLIGVDAEDIQLRVLAHYMDDKDFTHGVTSGDEASGTDPHTLNWRALGEACKSRNDAKTFIYAWLLGAGVAKVAEILGCSREEAQQSVENFLDRYQGLRYTKEVTIVRDAQNGYFQGFDGRFVRAKGDNQGMREYYMLGGYLQNGEAVIMKTAMCRWTAKLRRERVPFWLVNFVHDEWQTETVKDLDTAMYIAKTQAEAIRQVAEDFGLKCPFAGSVFSKNGPTVIDGKKWAIGQNWLETH